MADTTVWIQATTPKTKTLMSGGSPSHRHKKKTLHHRTAKLTIALLCLMLLQTLMPANFDDLGPFRIAQAQKAGAACFKETDPKGPSGNTSELNCRAT